MKTKKNFGILIITVAVIIAIAKIGTSLAYFYTEKEHSSTYQVAQIETKIDETFEKVSEGEYTKNPKIQNVGKSDCIVRVKIVITPSSQQVTLQGLNNNQNWVYHNDGYYYYQGVVSTDKETTTLFDKVIIDNVVNMEDFDIIVYNEAIQTKAYDDEGHKISALDESGQYNQENALQLWQYYQ